MNREQVEAVLAAESECLLIQYLGSGGVHVSSPNQAGFEASKWFLFQRRHDAIRLVQTLTEQGRLGTRSFDMAFCPRDCPVGGTAYNYSGMPPPRGSHEVRGQGSGPGGVEGWAVMRIHVAYN